MCLVKPIPGRAWRRPTSTRRNSSGKKPFNFGGTLYAAGKSGEALAIYRRLASSRPDDSDALNDVAYMLCETGGNLDEALKFAQLAVQKSPEQTGYVDTLG